MFTIHLLPAAYGDAILIEYGQPGDIHFVLIDGGPYSDYADDGPEKAAWQAAQDHIAQSGGQLELLVVSHVDADHIEGVVNLLNQDPLPFRPADVWFNGWEHLTDLLGAVAGELLSTLIVEHKLSWNGAFGKRAVVCPPDQPLPVKNLCGGMQLTLLSPTRAALEALAPTWETVVVKAGLKPGEAVSRTHKAWKDILGGKTDIEKWAGSKFTNDHTPPNGSSIAFLAEYAGKTCLFAADARSSIVEKSLQAILQQRGLKKLPVDAFKLAHHGSKNNLSPTLLPQVDCQRYLVSTNGDRFQHPDDIAMARILLHCKTLADAAYENGNPYTSPTVYFNYQSVRTLPWDAPGLKSKYAYKTCYPPSGQAGLVIDLDQPIG